MRARDAERDDTEQAIVEALESLVADRTSADRVKARSAWTPAIKDAIRPLAPRFGFRSGTGEWLYDLCWYRMSRGEGGNLIDLGLVLESEWNPDPELDGDFQKLVQARAAHRVWIFRCGEGESTASHFRACRAQIEAFIRTQVGDRYLLIGFDKARCCFSFQTCVASDCDV